MTYEEMRVLHFGEDNNWGELFNLCCPDCGGANLHHRKDVKQGTDKWDDSLTVEFWCEGCDYHPQLVILQHEGTTFVGWAKSRNTRHSIGHKKLAQALAEHAKKRDFSETEKEYDQDAWIRNCDCDPNLGEGCPDCTPPDVVSPSFNLNPLRSLDPWKHRSKGMRCQTCMWFVLKEASKAPEQGTRMGRCRRHAPTMNGYPVVFEHDWCGDHKLDEEKH